VIRAKQKAASDYALFKFASPGKSILLGTFLGVALAAGITYLIVTQFGIR
jgi:hypothetical protein